MASLTLNKWGHSYGIRIPQVLLKQLHIALGDHLEIEADVRGRRLILKPVSERQGWLNAFNQQSDPVAAVEMPFDNEFDHSEWTW
jgi:antitoxin component of MazEF toxin-antitoxin module